MADREFCKKLREQVVELRDRNTVLRVAASGKTNVRLVYVQSTDDQELRAVRQGNDERKDPRP